MAYKERLDRRVRKLDVRLENLSKGEDIVVNMYTPKGKRFPLTDSHTSHVQLSRARGRDITDAWMACLKQVEKGLKDCDVLGCEYCE